MSNIAVKQVVFFCCFFSFSFEQMWKSQRAGWDAQEILENLHQQTSRVDKLLKGRGGRVTCSCNLNCVSRESIKVTVQWSAHAYTWWSAV